MALLPPRCSHACCRVQRVGASGLSLHSSLRLPVLPAVGPGAGMRVVAGGGGPEAQVGPSGSTPLPPLCSVLARWGRRPSIPQQARLQAAPAEFA